MLVMPWCLLHIVQIGTEYERIEQNAITYQGWTKRFRYYGTPRFSCLPCNGLCEICHKSVDFPLQDLLTDS